MTEQEWLGNTRPVYPKQLPAIDHTVDIDPALLADPQGRALVQAIHDPANPRLEANSG